MWVGPCLLCMQLTLVQPLALPGRAEKAPDVACNKSPKTSIFLSSSVFPGLVFCCGCCKHCVILDCTTSGFEGELPRLNAASHRKFSSSRKRFSSRKSFPKKAVLWGFPYGETLNHMSLPTPPHPKKAHPGYKWTSSLQCARTRPLCHL